MITTAVTIKTCSTCHRSLPLGEFVRRKGSKDGRRNRCKACSAEYFRQWRVRRRTRALDKSAARLGRERNLRAAVALAAQMTVQFGGAARLAEFWVGQIYAAAEAAPGSVRVLRHLAGISHLIAATAPRRPDCETMTDAELTAEAERLLAECGW